MKHLVTLALAALTAPLFAQTTQPTQPSSTQTPAATPQQPTMPPAQGPSETPPASAPSATEAPRAPQAPSSVDPSATRPAQADDDVEVALQARSEWPVFEKLDANADGYINAQEAAENPQLRAMWSELDQDQNGSLSSGEYARGRERNDTRDTSR